MNLYRNRDSVKIIVLVVAVVISGISLWYTRALVKTLQERERKLIDLFAKSYKAIGSAEEPDAQSFLFLEIIETNNSIPVILTDAYGQIISDRNLDLPKGISEAQRDTLLKRELVKMKEAYQPIPIEVPGLTQFVFYRNSDLVERLSYYPYVQLSVIAVFAVFAYMAFSYSRRAEQNRVWVGLAKETAHQLGTPLSSLMAWVEYFKADDRYATEEFVDEMAKDVEKLEIITSRFSNIGSVPQLKDEDLAALTERLVEYMRRRISTKVKIEVDTVEPPLVAAVNKSLFEWVLDNLIRNAVDAMGGVGQIHIRLARSTRDGRIYIDITDNGKGMTKAQQKRAFDPGFTTKTRGWGLGLTLSRRIMEHYHKGRLTIRRSEPGAGTTFRVVV